MNLSVNWHDEFEERIPCLLQLSTCKPQVPGGITQKESTSFVCSEVTSKRRCTLTVRGQTHITASGNIIKHCITSSYIASSNLWCICHCQGQQQNGIISVLESDILLDRFCKKIYNIRNFVTREKGQLW